MRVVSNHSWVIPSDPYLKKHYKYCQGIWGPHAEFDLSVLFGGADF